MNSTDDREADVDHGRDVGRDKDDEKGDGNQDIL